MKYFLDTEFEESDGTIMPISLGMVDLHGRSLYIQFDFDRERAHYNKWVRENVLPQLDDDVPRISIREARKHIMNFMGLPKSGAESKGKTEIWAYYAATDWVLFYQLWGTLMDLPKGMPRNCMCLRQWYQQLGFPKDHRPKKPEGAHNALVDAQWNLKFYQELYKFDRWMRK